MSGKARARCSLCELPGVERICINPKGRGTPGCPTLVKREAVERAGREYRAADVREFARQAAIQEGSCYERKGGPSSAPSPVKPRIQEIGEFARRMGYSRLGLVFCLGLAAEAAMTDRILAARGFEVHSVCCKVGSVPKEEIGLAREEKINGGRHESMCNPIAQARLMNESGVQFNILLGLCVGHDSLFFRYAEAPTTVLAVKDRLTGHNPLAAVYTSNSYYRGLMVEED